MKICIGRKGSEQERALGWVASACAPSHYFSAPLRGVLFSDEKEYIRAVGTDGRVLHTALFHPAFIERLGVFVNPPGCEHSYSIGFATEGKTLIFGGRSTGAEYPRWWMIWPRDNHLKIYLQPAESEDERMFANNFLVRVQDAGEQIPRINPTYMERVALIRPELCEYGGAEKPMLFSSPWFTAQALVAPMRRNNVND